MGKNFIPWANPDIGKEEFKQIKDSFKKNWLTQGPKVKKFEKLMADYCNVPYAVAVSNGTVALDIALKTLGIKSGDEVIVPAMSYFSSASMVSYQNAIPVFVDIKEDDFNINPLEIEKAITRKTKAIIFIDYGGNPSDIDKILAIGKKHNLHVLQDGAQSLGGIYKGKKTGANAKISTMSFHMAKILSCVEGGMVFTHSKKMYSEILMRRSHGEKKSGDYLHNLLGTNARLTDMQAGIGLAQIKKINKFVNKRGEVAKKYKKKLKNIEGIKLPTVKKNCKNAYFFFPILINKRDKIAKNLKSKYNIDTRIAYKMPIYEQKIYKSTIKSFKKLNCPIAEKITSKILNLPMFPSLRDQDISYIVSSLKKEIKKK